MPYYGIPKGQTDEDVAMAYNRYILTDLLRDELGFDGVICTDWGVVTGRVWGVEALTIEQRYLKSVQAGIDQYGGESEPEYIVALVDKGDISEARIDESVRRISGINLTSVCLKRPMSMRPQSTIELIYPSTYHRV
jgi:beta-glucosidase